MNENFWSVASKHPILMIVGIGVGLSGVAKIVNAARGETKVNSLIEGFGEGVGKATEKAIKKTTTNNNVYTVDFNYDEEDGA